MLRQHHRILGRFVGRRRPGSKVVSLHVSQNLQDEMPVRSLSASARKPTS